MASQSHQKLVHAKQEQAILYNIQGAVAKIKVEEHRWKPLQKLAHNADLEQRLKSYAAAIPHLDNWPATDQEIMDSKNYFLGAIRNKFRGNKHKLRQIKEFMEYSVRARQEFDENFTAVFQVLQGLPFRELESREKVNAGFNSFVQEYQKLHRGAIKTKNAPGRQEMLKALEESLSQCPADLRSILEETLYLSHYAYENAVDSFFGLKKERAKQLLGISQILGMAYLSYDFITMRMIELFPNYPRPVGALEFSHQESLQYFRRDTEVYREIIDSLRPEQKCSPEPRDELAVRIIIDPAEIADIPPTKQYLRTKLLTALMLPSDERFSDDNKARIQYFIEDVLGNGYEPTKTEELAARLEEFNLKRRLRRVEDRLSDVCMRNFFDDIMLKYIHQNAVPTDLELERLYNSNAPKVK